MQEKFEATLTPKIDLEIQEPVAERAFTQEERDALEKQAALEDETAAIAQEAQAAETTERIAELRKELGITESAPETLADQHLEESPESLEKDEGNNLPPKNLEEGDDEPDEHGSSGSRMVRETEERVQHMSKEKKRPSFLKRLLKFFFSNEKASFKKGLELSGVLDEEQAPRKTQTTSRKQRFEIENIKK